MRPLRTIVRTYSKPGPLGHKVYSYEVLECGHEQRQKTDIYGPTNAYRRRCRQCPTVAKSDGATRRIGRREEP